jgi:uncharacterized DUF497 family protein
MKNFWFCCGLAILISINIFFVTANAQTPLKETEKRFKLVGGADGDKAIIEFFKTSDGNSIEVQAIRLKSVKEAKKRIEQLLSEAKEILEVRTSFRKAENETLAYYLLLFEDSKNKTTYYKIATLSNELVVFTTASTKELVLEFEKWRYTQK